MATRIGYSGTEVAGDVLTAANFTKLPNGLVAYAPVTASQTGVATGVTDLVGLTVTFTFPSSRMYKITGHLGGITQNVSGGIIKIQVRDGTGTVVGTICNTTFVATARSSVDGCTYISPSSGSATYKLSGFTSANTFDLSANASGSDPGPSFILLEDVGPAF